jgi:hypothetical protein
MLAGALNNSEQNPEWSAATGDPKKTNAGTIE